MTFRLLAHVRRSAVGDLAAEIERDDVVRDRHHQVHVMLDQENSDREALADLKNALAQLAELLVVEPRRRFVEQQQFRLRRQRARKLHALLIAERQIRNDAPADAGDAQELGQLGGALAQHPLFAPHQRQRHGVREKSAATAAMAANHDVLDHRQRSEQRQVLERPPNAEGGDAVDRVARERLAFEPNGAVFEAVEARKTIEQRGLAGAVRPDQAADFAARDREADRIERDHAAKPYGDVLDCQQRGTAGDAGSR